MNPIKLAVLDDHALILEAIRALIDSEPTINYWGGFHTLNELESNLTTEKKPDVLLLDIQLENEDGIKICVQLSKKYPDLKIIMLSSMTQSAIVMDALKKGAVGYLPKNISLDDLKEACDTVINGKTYIHQEISFSPSSKKESKYDYIPKLTRREKEVLSLIMEEKTTSEIAEMLHLTVSTVETHRSSLLIKTGAKNVVGLIKYTIEKGLLD